MDLVSVEQRTPTPRIMALLMMVARERGRPVPAARLRRLAGYPDPDNDASARRLLTMDLEVLKQRGLVVTEQYVDEDHGTSGVAFNAARNHKDVDLQLTRAEHRLLVDLRRQFRQGRPVTAMPTGDAVEAVHEVERLFQIVRLLEEHERAMEFVELQGYLGCSSAQLRRWLAAVSDVYNDFGGSSMLECVYPDDDSLAVAGAVLVRPVRATAESSLRHAGLDLLGLFPYSREEVSERLCLVEVALADLDPASPERRKVPALERLRRKLAAWDAHLADARLGRGADEPVVV